MRRLATGLLEMLTAVALLLSSTVAFLVSLPFRLLVCGLFWALTGELVWDMSKSQTMRDLYEQK